MRPQLDISVNHGVDETVVALSGEIDISVVSRLEDSVDSALEDRPSRLVLDMHQVTLCDSQGLGTLVVLNRKATRNRSSLVLTNVSPALRHQLDVIGLLTAFTIRDEQDTAS